MKGEAKGGGPAARPIRLLLVDDHRVVREGLQMMLGLDPGIEVVGEAADGLDAVERHRALRPDITLIDLRMPRMDGPEAMAAIRQEDPGARFIVLTSFDSRRDVDRALHAGALCFLLKSSSAEEVMAAIHRVHQGGGAIDPQMFTQVDAQGGVPLLSAQEQRVLEAVAQGLANKEIADEMGLSESTVKFHLNVARSKLGAKDRTEAVVIAVRNGIIRI